MQCCLHIVYKNTNGIITDLNRVLPRASQVLEIDCMTGVGPKAWAKDFTLVRQGLVAALRKCLQLRRLVCRPTTLVENDLLDILAINRMQKLEVRSVLYKLFFPFFLCFITFQITTLITIRIQNAQKENIIKESNRYRLDRQKQSRIPH